jgi:hypothetical protein
MHRNSLGYGGSVESGGQETDARTARSFQPLSPRSFLDLVPVGKVIKKPAAQPHDRSDET